MSNTDHINGGLGLKKLRGRHLAVINLYMMGTRQNDIADKLGYSPAWLSLLLSDPLVVGEIQKRVEEERRSLNPLYVKSLRVMDDAMDATVAGDSTRAMHTVRLRAADMVMKVRGEYGNEEQRETAEDVIQRMLQVNIQANIHLGSTTPEQAEGSRPPVLVEGTLDGND